MTNSAPLLCSGLCVWRRRIGYWLVVRAAAAYDPQSRERSTADELNRLLRHCLIIRVTIVLKGKWRGKIYLVGGAVRDVRC